jgi:hypothetical protein
MSGIRRDDGEVEEGLSEELNFVTPFTSSLISRSRFKALLISVSLSLSLSLSLLKSLMESLLLL